MEFHALRFKVLSFPRFSSATGWGSCYQFFLMLPAEPRRQELHRRLVAEGRMLPFSVVKDLDVFKGGGFNLSVRRVANAMHALVLEAVGPTFGWDIIPTIAFTAHRADHAVFFEFSLKFFASILATPI